MGVGLVQDFSSVPADLRNEETYVFILRSLEKVKTIADETFGTIRLKVDSLSERLRDMDRRVDVCCNKIETLKNMKKATVVFSSPKYPVTRNRAGYSTVLSHHGSTTQTRPQTISNQINISEKVMDFDPKKMAAKLQHFNVKELSLDMTHIPDHLGRPSKTLRSSTSLLIFNTAQTPYQTGATVDPLEVAAVLQEEVPDGAQKVDGEQNLGDGVNEIDRLDVLGGGNDLFYMPDMDALPEFDLPDQLDLENIAQGINFNLAEESKIVPSLNLAQYDLPDIEMPDGGAEPQVSQCQTEMTETIGLEPRKSEGQANTIITADQGSLPPPPPAPSVGQHIESRPNSFKQESTQAPASLEPPKPKLLVEAPNSFPAQTSAEAPNPLPTQTSAEAPNVPPTPEANGGAPLVTMPAAPPPPPPEQFGRDSLLEAIRNAGGAKGAGLKSVQDRNDPVPSRAPGGQEKSETSSGGGDLMSDLMAKLTLRRQGISGDRQQSAPPSSTLDADSTMDRVSRMIPPPPMAEVSDEEVDSDNSEQEEDWD